MMSARIKIDTECSSIEVRRGEYVTVWLRMDDGSGFDRVQCELRVAPDGRPEVFLPPDRLGIVASFKTWTPDPLASPPPAATPSDVPTLIRAIREACERHGWAAPDEQSMTAMWSAALPAPPAALSTETKVKP